MIKTKQPWEYNSKEKVSATLYLRAINPSFVTHVPIPMVTYTVQMFVKDHNTNVFYLLQKYSATYKIETFLSKFGKEDQGNTLVKLFTEADQRLIDQIAWVNGRPEDHWLNSIQGRTHYFGWTADDLELYTPPEGSQFVEN